MKQRPRKAQPAPRASAPLLPRIQKLLPFAALVLVVLIAYSNSSGGLLLLDNERIILKDTRIRAATFENVQSILTQPYWQMVLGGLYRPLTTLSYLFNYAMLENGANAAAYHWVNLLLHLLNVGLVYWLGLVIFEETGAAWLLGALWGLHPVLTESVTNVIGRADLLAAFGVLAGLFCHRMALRRTGSRRAAWLTALMAAAAIGIFSKESAIVLVAVLALHDLAFGVGTPWRMRVAGYAAAVLPCLIYLYARSKVLAHAFSAPVPFTDNPIVAADFWTARLTAIKVIGKFLWLWLWPANLSYDYSYNEIPLAGWRDGSAILAIVVCAALMAAAVWSWRRNRAVSFAIALFFIALSPTSNLAIRIGSIMAERFLYLPSVGLAILAVCGLRLLAKPQVYRAGAAVLLIALAARTYARNADWLDERRFWQSGVDAAPGSFRTNIVAAFTALPLTPENRGRVIAETDRALAILDGLPDAENSPDTYRDAGTIYRLVGDGGATEGTTREYWYRKSLAALLRDEKLETVRDEIYRRENGGRGSFVSAGLYLELGRTYLRLSNPQNAIAAFERGRTQASDPDLLEDLADAYVAAGELRKAAMALVEALAVDSKRVRLNGKLVELYGKIDPQGCSISHEGGQLSLNIECPLVHGDICTASRNVAAGYDRGGMSSDAAFIRGVALRDLGCAAEILK
jgi:tetratricopeptide (TPR) repeat protein